MCLQFVKNRIVVEWCVVQFPYFPLRLCMPFLSSTTSHSKSKRQSKQTQRSPDLSSKFITISDNGDFFTFLSKMLFPKSSQIQSESYPLPSILGQSSVLSHICDLLGIRYESITDVPTVDRISLLPDSVLVQEILVRLPLREVVRTSILSKRWASLWTQLPNIEFDYPFFKYPIIQDSRRLKSIIFNIMYRMRKPLHSFKFTLNGFSDSDIDQLVYYVSLHGVRNFELECDHELHMSLFSCVDLNCLKLSSCVFKLPGWFNGFSMLSYLSFSGVTIDGRVCSSLVSSCPVLEILILEYLSLGEYKSLVLVSPSLRVFSYDGEMVNLCINFAPRMEQLTVSMHDYWLKEDKKLVVPFKVLSAITHVVLNWCFFKYINWEKELEMSGSILNNLKSIVLEDVCFEKKEQALNILYLLRRSPNLETFRVKAWTNQWDLLDSEPALGAWENENLLDVSLYKLQTFEVNNMTGMRSEMLFIKNILAKSPIIERLRISTHRSVWKEKNMRIMEEVSNFDVCVN